MNPLSSLPSRYQLNLVFHKAKKQMSIQKGTQNEKKKLVKNSPTPEQTYFYDWIEFVFHSLGISREIFARQLQVTPRTVQIWLQREGNFPSGTRLSKLFELYEANLRRNEQPITTNKAIQGSSKAAQAVQGLFGEN